MRISRPLLATLFLSMLLTAICPAEDADEFREKGIAALKDSQANPRAIVEAARAFVKASELYVTAGNEDKAIEMNSFLYWCKKKMAMEDIDAFVKGGEAGVSNKLNAIEKLAPKADEAQNYLDRAEQFANKNPAEHLLIAIRFYEVADRFKASETGMKAMDRSLKELVQDKSSGAKSTLPPTAIRVPDTAPATVGSRPIPSADDIKQAEKLIKDILKDEYAKTDAPGRQALAKKLIQQADENKGDPASEYVLLHEARDNAVAGGDIATATDAQKRLRDGFKIDFAAMLTDLRKLESTAKSADAAAALATLLSLGADDALAVDNYDQAVRYNSHAEDLLPLIKNPDLKAHLKSEIARALALKQASAAALAALKTLGTKPDDPEANLTAGKFALQKADFEKSFALLAKSSDKTLSSLAKRELTPAAEAPEQAKLGDDWFDLAAKESNPYLKKAMQDRAGVWYGNALPALTGLAKLKIEGRIKTLPQTSKTDAATPPMAKLEPAQKQWISKDANYTVSQPNTQFPPSPRLLNGQGGGHDFVGTDHFAFMSKGTAPYIVIDLHAPCAIQGLEIRNRENDHSEKCRSLTVWSSGQAEGPWTELWRADKSELVWDINFPRRVPARFIKIGLRENEEFTLFMVKVFGDDSTPKRETIAAPPGSRRNELILDLGGGVKLEMVAIPPGTFQMGSPTNEKNRQQQETPHTVTISRPFYIGKFPITQEQYEAVLSENHSNFKKSGKYPIERTSWDEAKHFCDSLNTKVKDALPAGLSVQLPTEAQWEYACRAGTKTRFYSGDSEPNLDTVAWYTANSNAETHPVGEKKPNPWGLYDMLGNISQWCSDWKADYATTAQVDPHGPASGTDKILRGGSWNSKMWDCRAAVRLAHTPDTHDKYYGFRVVLSTE